MANRIKGITVEIGGDTTKLQTALKGVNGEIRNTQSQLKDVEKLLKLDHGNTELLAQKQRLLADAVSETKDKLTTLETAAEQANTALANGDISQEQYDALQREIIETQRALQDLETQASQSSAAFSASECADALNYLALAGYDTQEMCDTLPTVLNLAAAGNIDLASASDMVTDAMSALGMGVSEAGTMVDQMSKTSSTTNTSVAQLGEGILTIGATANKAAAMMEQLGIQVYDSQGNMRSMNEIMGDLNTSMDGMTSADKDGIINTIFNKTDLAAVNSLPSNTGSTWDDLQQSITDSGGAAQQMADTQLDNLQGQLTILKSALEGLAISFGEILIPAIKSIVDGVQGFIDKLNGLDDGTKKTIGL